MIYSICRKRVMLAILQEIIRYTAVRFFHWPVAANNRRTRKQSVPADVNPGILRAFSLELFHIGQRGSAFSVSLNVVRKINATGPDGCCKTVILNKTVFCGVHISRHACPGQTINSPMTTASQRVGFPQRALLARRMLRLPRSLAPPHIVPLRVEARQVKTL